MKSATKRKAVSEGIGWLCDQSDDSVRWPMHTGQLEDINNRIKVMKRMAYGYRDRAYFFLKIKATYSGNP